MHIQFGSFFKMSFVLPTKNNQFRQTRDAIFFKFVLSFLFGFSSDFYKRFENLKMCQRFEKFRFLLKDYGNKFIRTIKKIAE